MHTTLKRRQSRRVPEQVLRVSNCASREVEVTNAIGNETPLSTRVLFGANNASPFPSAQVHAMLHRVCAVDVGYRNFAWCVMDAHSVAQPIAWHVEDLWPQNNYKKRRTPNTRDLVNITTSWITRNRALLDTCTDVVLEVQMRQPFVVMNTTIMALLGTAKVTEVSPMTVRAFFNLPYKRRDKKAAGIALAKQHAQLPANEKQDDLADAWMMALHKLCVCKQVSKARFM